MNIEVVLNQLNGGKMKRIRSAPHDRACRPGDESVSVLRRPLALIGITGLLLAAFATAEFGDEIPKAHALSEHRITVTDGSDPGSGEGSPGTLRAALTEAQRLSAEIDREPTNFVITFAASASEVTLAGDLTATLGGVGHSLEVTGSSEVETTLAMNGFKVVLDSAEGAAIGFSTLTVVGGSSISTYGSETLSFNGVQSNNTEYALSAESSLEIRNSHFVESGVDARLEGDESRLDLIESSFTGLTDDSLLSFYGGGSTAGLGMSVTVDSLALTNSSQGIRFDGVGAAEITRSSFTDSTGTQVLSIGGNQENPQTLSLSDNVFTGNHSDSRMVHLSARSRSLTVTGNTFQNNTASSGEILHTIPELYGAAFDSPSADASANKVSMTLNRFLDNSIRNASSLGLVSLGHAMRNDVSSADVLVSENYFRGNQVPEDSTELQLHADQWDPATVVSTTITGNTFDSTSTSSMPHTGRLIDFTGRLAANTIITNNTFVAPEHDSPLVKTISRLGEEDTVTLENNTFVGGGIEIPLLHNYGNGVTIRGTVFDTAVDPISVSSSSGAIPSVVEDVWTRTASAAMPSATIASSEDFALGELGEHGGLLPTLLPGSDSVLVDAATAPSTLGSDQRGVPRPQGTAMDIGAVERIGGTVSLAENITVTEGESAIIPVIRTVPEGYAADGPITASLAMTDGTAQHGSDYSLAKGEIHFGEDTAEEARTAETGELVIPTINRPGAQGERAFTVTISELTPGASIADPQSVTVTIVEEQEPAVDTDAAGADVDSADGLAPDGTDGTGTDGSSVDGGIVDGGTDVPDSGTTPGGTLSETGAQGQVWLLWGGLGVLVLGAALIMIRRLRSRSGEPPVDENGPTS